MCPNLIYSKSKKLFSNGIKIVVSNNCAAIIKISGVRSRPPAVGMNLLKKLSTGKVSLSSTGAMGV